MEDDEERTTDRTSARLSWITSFFMLLVVGVAVAELVFAIHDRDLTHQAFTNTQVANGIADRANQTAQMADDTASRVSMAETRIVLPLTLNRP